MARFPVSGAAVVDNNKSVLVVHQGTTPSRRLKIYDITVGSIQQPADQAVGCQFKATGNTLASGGVAFNPADIRTEPGEGACSFIYRVGPTVEPGFLTPALMHYIPLNQRATVRWFAVNKGELVIAATPNFGCACVADTPTIALGFKIQCTEFIEE